MAYKETFARSHGVCWWVNSGTRFTQYRLQTVLFAFVVEANTSKATPQRLRQSEMSSVNTVISPLSKGLAGVVVTLAVGY